MAQEKGTPFEAELLETEAACVREKIKLDKFLATREKATKLETEAACMRVEAKLDRACRDS